MPRVKVAISLLLLTVFFLSLPFFAYAQNGRSYIVIHEETGNSYTIEYDGLVPCGRCFSGADTKSLYSASDKIRKLSNIHCLDRETESREGVYVPCDICHTFIVFNNVISYLLTRIIPALGVLMITVSGALYFLAAGGANPEKVRVAKRALIASVVGIAISYAAWGIVLAFLSILWPSGGGLWEEVLDHGPVPSCPIEIVEVVEE